MSLLRSLFFFAFAATLSACAQISVTDMSVKATMLTSGGDGPRYRRVPQKVFSQSDMVVFITTVEWKDIEKSAGSHDVSWKWFNNDKLVTIVKRTLVLKTTPYELWSNISGQSIGVGNNRVEFFIGDKLISTEVFSVQ